jgi:PKHD-type hydroxylase
MIIEKPYLTNWQPYQTYEKSFTEEECQYISSLGWKWQDALVSDSSKRDNKIRNSDVFWLHPRQDLMWIWERLRHFVQEANSHVWRFNLENFHEDIQLTRYTKKGHYDWHMDVGYERMSFRKVSCVLNLSNQNEYTEGGTLIKCGAESTLLSKGQGDLHIFPSFVLHKAKKVSKGVRKSLVCWVGGEPYK